MTIWQITISIIIIALSIIMPIYYSSKKKKKAQEKELQKIKMYGERINQFTRNKS
jgi:type II secretory pathway pseudopilin PulG